MRLIADDGKQVGVLSRDEALDYALAQGKDLVLIGENAQPPVAKAVDYKKFMYQEAKKEKEAKKGQKASGIKEVRVGSPFVAAGDLDTRARQIGEFLEEGYLVKVSVKFVGRQITHPEFGHRIFDQLRQRLEGKVKVDKEPHFEGKFLVATFSNAKV